jgi:RecA-family ATPase
MQEVKEREWDFLWEGIVPLGAVTLLEGRKGSGKTTLAAAIAASISGGPQMPGDKKRKVANVLWAGGEEDLSSAIKPRLLAAGAKAKNLYCPHDSEEAGRQLMLQLPKGATVFAEAMKSLSAKLAVLDPLSSHVESGISLNDEQQARSVLTSLQAVATHSASAILCLRHLRKNATGPASDHGIGSVAIAATSRSVIRTDAHPDKKGFYVLSHVACSVGPLQPSQLFTLVKVKHGVMIKWEGLAGITAEEICEIDSEHGERDERMDAVKLLQTKLQAGWVSAIEVMAEAKRAGISERRLRSAKAMLMVKSRRVVSAEDAKWEWGLTDAADDASASAVKAGG